jgi:hypothetical protein
MAYKRYAKIRVRPIVYETDTNGDYELDTNGDKIISVQPNKVNPENPYDVLVEIDEDISDE